MVDMRTAVASLTLPNPVLTASGCAAAGRELDQFFDVSAARRRRDQVDHGRDPGPAGRRRGWRRRRAAC